MKACIYCGEQKADEDFSDEHIWPDALGGDHLSDFWRTDDVCQRCNSVSGLFVDGSFIRSWLGSAERASGAYEYLSVNEPEKAILPLHYMGNLPGLTGADDHVADYWIGPCGANIVHFRTADEDEAWVTYAGGNPKKGSKRKTAGRAYMALTSEEPFWIVASLLSFKAHFKNAELFITNMNADPNWKLIKNPDRSDPLQAADLKVFDELLEASRRGEEIHLRTVVDIDLGGRLLAKLGLAIGYKLFGTQFLETTYASHLRDAFREGNAEKRRGIPVQGTGYIAEDGASHAIGIMKWEGAWVLVLLPVNNAIMLTVVTPSGRNMSIAISDDPDLLGSHAPTLEDGTVWLTIPSLGQAVGPIALPEYVAHLQGLHTHPQLAELAAKRNDPATLPPCRQDEVVE